MSNYLINNNNIDNFNFEDIIIGTKIITSDIKSKHYIYYHKNEMTILDCNQHFFLTLNQKNS